MSKLQTCLKIYASFQIGDSCFHETLRVGGIHENFSSSVLLAPLTIIPALCLYLPLGGRKHPRATEELQSLASWNCQVNCYLR